MTIIREFKWRTPAQTFRPLADMPWAHCFQAGQRNKDQRWAFIVAHPATRLILRDGHFLKNDQPVDGDFAAIARSLSAACSDNGAQAEDQSRPPFTHGLAGFVGYEAARMFEPSLNLPGSQFGFPDLALGYYEAVAAFDVVEKKFYIGGLSDHAIDHLAKLLRLDAPVEPYSDPEIVTADKAQCNFSRAHYEKAVSTIREAILNGDIFQANISRQISVLIDRNNIARPAVCALDLFNQITKTTDATHAALLQFDDAAIVSNSPERFFKVTRNRDQTLRIDVEPIKGTMPRSDDPVLDQHYADKLLSSEKDRAENIMIADLLRNDLSRVCMPHSIREDEICALMSLTYVHHLVSRISGTLSPHLDALDALAALFPCGSITGAPKIEAMRAIARTEEIGRGPYCGAIGYIDDHGNADFSVAIRTMMIEHRAHESMLTIPVGGGITLRSDPQAEYEETALKALGLMTAITPEVSKS